VSDPTNQSASPSASPSTPAAPAASPAASPSSPQTPAADAPVRPAELADKAFDAYFDPQKGVKFDAFAKDFNDLRAHKAQTDLAAATVPTDVNGYNGTIPDTIDWPKTAKGEVVKFAIADDDPALAEFKKFALESKMPQEQFTKTISLYARMRASEDAMIANARVEQQGKLGANGPARVDAVSTFLSAKLGSERGAALMDRLVLADDVAAMEDLIKAFSTQGGGHVTQLHRDKPDNQLSEDEYNALSPAERRARTLRKAS
jgi:hypothetical protein